MQREMTLKGLVTSEFSNKMIVSSVKVYLVEIQLKHTKQIVNQYGSSVIK